MSMGAAPAGAASVGRAGTAGVSTEPSGRTTIVFTLRGPPSGVDGSSIAATAICSAPGSACVVGGAASVEATGAGMAGTAPGKAGTATSS